MLNILKVCHKSTSSEQNSVSHFLFLAVNTLPHPPLSFSKLALFSDLATGTNVNLGQRLEIRVPLIEPLEDHYMWKRFYVSILMGLYMGYLYSGGLFLEFYSMLKVNCCSEIVVLIFRKFPVKELFI